MDKLAELYNIATGATPQTSLHKEFIKRNSKLNIEKAKKEVPFYANSTKDPLDAFGAWFKNTQNYVDDNNRNEYWQTALGIFPGSEDQAKDYMRTYLDSQSSKDSYQEEVFLRNAISKLPDWAVQEVQPRLGMLQAQNSNQNLMKAVNMYKTNLKQRMQKLVMNDLDLDVPEEEHLKDFLKLEAMNMLDVAKVENGRLIVADEKGNLIPAFQLDDSSKVFKNPAEQPTLREMDIIYRTAPDIMKDFIKSNLSSAKEKVALGNKVASSAATKMLESGDLSIESWGDAFSIMSENAPDTVLRSGIAGMVKKNPYMTTDDIINNVTKVSQLYPDIINEAELRRTNVSVPTEG